MKANETKAEILRLLKENEGFHSGQAISDLLHLSRTAVWKYIKALKEEGYQIESVTNRGYRLISSADLLTPPEVIDGLCTHRIARKVYWKEETTSTNEDAKRNYQTAEDGSLFVAEMQTAGRGRLGRSWISTPGEGVWMSLLLKPDAMPDQLSPITLLAGLCVCKAIRDIADLPAKIKWPNDVVVNGKKVCGILSELMAEMDRVYCLILGIGINVNTREILKELQDKATSLYLEAGHTISRVKLVQKIWYYFERDYDHFLKTGDWSSVIKAYKRHCVNLNRQVVATGPMGQIQGTAVDITPDGKLVIRTGDGLVAVGSGEVSIRGMGSYV